ncbi:phosphate ABC transporter substrate-binding protein PstS [Rhodoluna limnophila]|uniref:phosphate ABC transporter substrate-binding protein PstS n=1 Tax=Rhodoluna limnophila TaxID=232537 RepID=UPI003CCC7FB6
MKKSALKIAGLAIAGTIALTGCAANEGATNGDSLSGTLNGAGSSAMGSAQEAWIAAFQTANGAVTINYDPTGSGAGRESFISGAVNFAGSDSYLKDEELALTFAACAPGTTPFEVPVYISPIAVIFNVEGVTDLNLDAATIAGIFKGDITKWNDAAIVALNPEANLPAANITAVHRSDDSGTTKNFSDYLSKTAESIWDGEVSDVFPYQSGEGAKGTSGVVDAVTNGTNTIGYADASKAGSLSIAKLKVGEEFVALSNESAAAIVDASPAVEGRDATDLAIKIDRATTAAGAYPLVLVSYLIGCNEYADPAVGALVKAYASYLVSTDGQAHAATSAGSAPLSAALTAKVTAVVSAIK